MLVDVVELRIQGRKRDREELLRAVPIRGELELYSTRAPWIAGRLPRLTASLRRLDDRTEWALEPLAEARVTIIRGPSIVIVGQQQCVKYRQWDTYPQAWWCRPAVLGSPPPRPTRDVRAGQFLDGLMAIHPEQE